MLAVLHSRSWWLHETLCKTADDVTEDVALHVDNCAVIAVSCCSGLLRQKPVHSTVDVLVYEDVVTLQSVLVQNLPGTRRCQVAKALPPSGVELQR